MDSGAVAKKTIENFVARTICRYCRAVLSSNPLLRLELRVVVDALGWPTTKT